MTDLVTIGRSGAVATVTMNREPANALNQELQGELERAALKLAQDESVNVVVLRSALPKFFAAGADIGMIGDTWVTIDDTILSFKRMADAWAALPMPVIARVEGHAAGGGCELSLCCDFRIMARGPGRIGLPEVKLGVLASGGGTQRIPRLIGAGRALELTLRGQLIDADQAASIGLVTQAVDATDMDDAVGGLAEELAAMPRLSVAAAKRCILQAGDLALQDGFALEMREMQALALTDDAREGVAAFLERREPHFTGH